MRAAKLWVAAVLAAVCAGCGERPNLDGLADGGVASAVEAVDGGAARLADGRVVRLGSATMVGNKTVEQLTDVSGREQIKREISTAIDERFGKKAVSRIYFPQFVVQ